MWRFIALALASTVMLLACSQALVDHTIRNAGNPGEPASGGQNQCLSFDDLNFPDHPKATVIGSSEKFTKKWQIHNNCRTSTEGWYAQKVAGDVQGPEKVMLPPIPAGGSAEVSQEFTAPATRGGVYSALYRIFTPDGKWASGFWVDVGVR